MSGVMSRIARLPGRSTTSASSATTPRVGRDQGVDFDFGNARGDVGRAPKADSARIAAFETVAIRRRLAANAVEHARHQPIRQQTVDIRFAERGEPERHLAEQFDEDPAEAEHDQRPELRIDAQAQDPFELGRLIRLDQKSVEDDVRPRAAHALGD